MKTCKRCEQPKALTEFYISKASKDGLQRLCKACDSTLRKERHQKADPTVHAQNLKRWRENNPERWKQIARRAHRKLRGQIDTPSRPRPDICECCLQSSSREICEDHNHTTGLFRGWLCYSCNLALGNVRDNIETLKALITYLESSNVHKPSEYPAEHRSLVGA